jgi:rhomboid protease GluP
MTTIVALALLAVGYLSLSVDERARVLRVVVLVARRLRRAAHREVVALWTAIRERPVAFAAPALVAVSLGVFVCMLFGRGSLSDAATLIAWGASFGPRTTNGEWWRLATSPFVHHGFVTLTINAIALAEIGVLIERRVGRLAVWSAFASGALLANVVNLWTHPLGITTGASGGVCGVYGLLFALIVAERRPETDRMIPAADVRRFVPMTAVVLALNLLDGGVGTLAEMAAVVTGFVFGLAAVRHVQAGGARRTAVACAGVATLVVVAAAAVGRIVDVRPEIQRLVELEQRTAKMYASSYGTFNNNQMDIDTLARVIERTIVPALQEADDRVKFLQGVPQEERLRMSEAREYLRLRVESWLLRARGLRATNAPMRSMTSADADARYRSSLVILGSADAAERTALQVLHRLKS